MDKPRIAIPTPTSGDGDYNRRSLPQYCRGLEQAGAEAAVIPEQARPEEIAKILGGCQGILLPGSPADLDPQKYGEAKDSLTNPADPQRDCADELLLQDAHNLDKPILGICYGLQALNVWRNGTLVQHLDSAKVNHEAGRQIPVAHSVTLDPHSKLAEISPERRTVIEVNSSHHQAIKEAGDGLKVVARCREDGIIEAVEGIAPGHFVLGVQWHPERGTDEFSRAIFQALVDAARSWRPRKISESVAQ